MRDDYFGYFIEKMGEATMRTSVPEAAIQRWRERLPDQLLIYWRNEGWCGYGEGIFWTVNPDDYEDLVSLWLEGTPFAQIDRFHIIARNAFGSLYAWGEQSGSNLTIACPINVILALERNFRKGSYDAAHRLRVFFSSKQRNDFDMKDQNNEALFERALRRLGPLASDEVYGFEPALVAGGSMNVNNLVKVKLHVHLTILRQIENPRVPLGIER